MSNKPFDITGADRTMQELLQAAQDLKSGDGGGNSGGMEERLAKLEAHMEHVQTDVSNMTSDMKSVRDRLIALEVKVDHLPTKGFTVMALLACLAVIAALIGFQEQVQSIVSSKPTS